VRNWNEELSVVFAPSGPTTHLVLATAGELLAEVSSSPDGVDLVSLDAQAGVIDGLLAAGLIRRGE
jgi:hypothetical protein